MADASDLAWEAAEPYAQKWTDQAHRDQSRGTLQARLRRHEGVSTFYLAGPCPRCNHRLEQVRPHTAVVDHAKLFAGGQLATQAGARTEVDARCDCTEHHPGRPDGRHGCGVAFRIVALRE